MPTIGHRIQVDAASDATVFENEMPARIPDKKKARLLIGRRACSSCTIEEVC